MYTDEVFWLKLLHMSDWQLVIWHKLELETRWSNYSSNMVRIRTVNITLLTHTLHTVIGRYVHVHF